MARPLRIEFEGAVYHITSRGNAKQDIFLTRTDRIAFLQLFGEIVDRFKWICHSYCLMGNHYHLLLETPRANLSRGMRQLNSVYTQGFNRRHERVGHVLQGRYKSILVERDSHLLELTRYVVLNPVRSGFVRSPEEWAWSSYRAMAGFEPAPEFLETKWLLSQFDDDFKRAAAEYRAFVAAGIKSDPWDDLHGGILGSESFIKQMEPLLKERIPSRDFPKQEQYAARPSLERLFSDWNDKTERNMKIREAVWEHGYTLKEVADHLGLHYSTVSALARCKAGSGKSVNQRSDPQGLDDRKKLEPDRQCQK
jgi:REP element-mobilizing transposase RayT